MSVPQKSQLLGFEFYRNSKEWRCRPAKARKQNLIEKTKAILCRRKAVARTNDETFTKLNQTIRGWINYFRIGDMKGFLKNYGEWMRHKVRVIILKQWKRPKTIYKCLVKLNKREHFRFSEEDIFKVANSRLGLYKQASGDVVNFLISPSLLGLKTKRRLGLVDPLAYYLE